MGNQCYKSFPSVVFTLNISPQNELRYGYLVLPAHVVEDWQRLERLGNAAGLSRGSWVVVLIQSQNLKENKDVKAEFHHWHDVHKRWTALSLYYLAIFSNYFAIITK